MDINLQGLPQDQGIKNQASKQSSQNLNSHKNNPSISPSQNPGSLSNTKNTSNITKSTIKNVVQKLNDSMSLLNDKLTFSYNEDIKELVVKVIDNQTGQVIRQMPPEELIKLEVSLSKSIGIIFNKEVK